METVIELILDNSEIILLSVGIALARIFGKNKTAEQLKEERKKALERKIKKSEQKTEKLVKKAKKTATKTDKLKKEIEKC